jgi:cytoskeletal protein RodZ
LADLENDDYTNFPSMAYVRGFLLIYAKYLGVDVSDYTESLGSTATSVGIGDYEYLSNAPERRQAVSHRKPKRSLWPLLLLGILLGIGVCAAIIFSVIVNAQRLGNLEELGAKHVSEKASPGILSQDKAELAKTNPQPETAPQPSLRGEAPTPTPTPALVEVRRAESNLPETQAAATPAPLVGVVTPDSTTNEVVVKALKKTWVKIYKDTPGSVPIYEDWLFPDTLPLKLKGARFYIQMSDRTSLQILKNGVSQPIDQPVITIQ